MTKMEKSKREKRDEKRQAGAWKKRHHQKTRQYKEVWSGSRPVCQHELEQKEISWVFHGGVGRRKNPAMVTTKALKMEGVENTNRVG